MHIWFSKDHAAHYPVGCCSVVVANSEHEARGLLKAELHEHGLDEQQPFTLVEIDMSKPKALVLLDGDY